MIVANVKIHYGAYSKRYYTYWSQDVVISKFYFPNFRQC